MSEILATKGIDVGSALEGECQTVAKRLVMSTPARRVHYTYAEYLALEESSSVRHEFLDGEIYATAGGSPACRASAKCYWSRTGAPR